MKSALLVDSEPLLGELLQDILRSEGVEKITRAGASEAADYAHSQKFDVVFVDSSSPPAAAIEVTRRIRSSGYNANTPIVVIATPKNKGFLTEGFKAGANFVVYKPVDRPRLVRLVRVTQGAIENEIRRFRRVLVQVKAVVRRGEEDVEGATVDLSPNGALVQARRIFPRGSAVTISLFLEPTETIVGRGSVMRTVSSEKMGIQFSGLSLSAMARLQDFLVLAAPPPSSLPLR